MNDQQILEAIIESFKEVVLLAIENDNKQKQNSERGNLFINTIHGKLEELFSNETDVVVFSKTQRNRVFRRNEFLFDVHICKVNYLKSSVHKKEIPYVVESLVQLESEFEENIFDSVEDLNKLVCGKAQLKLMIVPLSNNINNYLDPLKHVAENISENLYVLFFPHPKRWDVSEVTLFKVFSFANGEWQEVALGQG